MFGALFPGALQNFRGTTSSTFPSGSAPNHILSQIPSSRSQLDQISSPPEGDGSSKSQDPIVINRKIIEWDVTYPYHKEVYKNQPIFCTKGGHSKTYRPVIMNLRQLNNFLREGYFKAKTLWDDRQTVIDNGILTEEEYDILFSTPTAGWHSLDFLNALLLDKQRSDYHIIRFLYEDGIVNRFEFLGYIRNTPEEMQTLYTAFIVKNTVEFVENIWSPRLYSGMKLGFVLKRLFEHGEHTCFAYDPRPWTYGTVPDLLSRSYVDVTGHQVRGYTFQIGTLDERLKAHPFVDKIVLESTGILPTTDPRYMMGPEEGTLRLTLCPRKELGVSWFH